VAHSRRNQQPDAVTPGETFRRLAEFLDRIDEPGLATSTGLGTSDE
jgi:hypothetical protein